MSAHTIAMLGLLLAATKAPDDRPERDSGLLSRVTSASTGVVADMVDLDAVLERIDVDLLVDQIDLDRLAKRLDMDALVEHIEMDLIVERIDIVQIISRLSTPETALALLRNKTPPS